MMLGVRKTTFLIETLSKLGTSYSYLDRISVYKIKTKNIVRCQNQHNMVTSAITRNWIK